MVQMVIKVNDKVEVILEHSNCTRRGNGCYKCYITRGKLYEVTETNCNDERFGNIMIRVDKGWACIFPIKCLKKIPNKMNILKQKLMGDKNVSV